ncbi:MAG TPA: hypothetical protein VNM22_12285 [Candidatus Limnocylindrales bacterium]|nr:hypothetical protein [Candidatus Limnocylindrales bacterium]
MKKIFSLLWVVFFVAGMTTMAIAQQIQESPAGGTTTQGSQQMGGQRETGVQTPIKEEGLRGDHIMMGTVSKVDKNDMVTLKTDHGNLMLHLPGASQNLKEGQTIHVRLGYYMPGEGGMERSGAAGQQGTTSGQGTSSEQPGASEQPQQDTSSGQYNR